MEYYEAQERLDDEVTFRSDLRDLRPRGGGGLDVMEAGTTSSADVRGSATTSEGSVGRPSSAFLALHSQKRHRRVLERVRGHLEEFWVQLERCYGRRFGQIRVWRARKRQTHCCLWRKRTRHRTQWKRSRFRDCNQ